MAKKPKEKKKPNEKNQSMNESRGRFHEEAQDSSQSREKTCPNSFHNTVGISQNNCSRIVVGEIPSLENSFEEEIIKLRRVNPIMPIGVIVNSHLVGLYLSRKLAQRGINHINIRFYTLDDLACSILRTSCVGKRYRILLDYIRQPLIMLIAKSFRNGNGSHSKEQWYFDPIADKPGFAKIVLSTIDDLRDACITPTDLVERSKGLSGIDQTKIDGFIRLWEAYEDICARNGLVDERGAVAQAKEFVWKSSEISEFMALIIYGFNDLTPLQRELIEQCVKTKPTVVFFPFTRPDLYGHTQNLLSWFESLGLQKQEVESHDPERSHLISHLCAQIFKHPKAFSGTYEDIWVMLAHDRYSEVRETVRNLLKLCIDERIDLANVAIVLRHPKQYSKLFAEQFDKVGISPYSPGAQVLADTYGGKCLGLMLDCLMSNFRRNKVIEFAKIADLPKPLAKTKAYWDMVSKLAGIVEGKEDWEDKLALLCRENKQKGIYKIACADLSKFFSNLSKVLTKVDECKSWTAKINAICAGIDELVKPNHEPHRKSLEGAKQAIAALSALDQVAEPTTQDFNNAANQVLNHTTWEPGHFQKDGVALISASAIKALQFDVVVISGLVDGEFPARKTQDPILPDHERRALNRAISGEDHYPIKLINRNHWIDEKLLFHTALSAARKKILLTRPLSEPESERKLADSPFLIATLETLAIDSHREKRPNGLIKNLCDEPTAPHHALTQREFDTLVFSQANALGQRSAVIRYFKAKNHWFRKAQDLERALRKPFITQYEGKLSSPDCFRKLESRIKETFSVTELETYATCPYRYFLTHIIGVEEMEEPEQVFQFPAEERGLLFHNLMRDFFLQLAPEAGCPITLKLSDMDLLNTFIKEELDKYEKQHPTGYPLLWKVTKEGLREMCRKAFLIALEDGKYRPTYFELSWGSEDGLMVSGNSHVTWDGLIQCGPRQIRIKGRMDRIDLADDGTAKVIDYKTGKSSDLKDNQFTGGGNLQLPLYLVAAQKIFGTKDESISVEVAEYLFLHPRSKKTRVEFSKENLTKKTTQEDRDDLTIILDTIISGIEKGHFFPASKDCHPCQFKSICRYLAKIIEKRKFEDPDLQRIRTMQQIE